MATKQLYWNVNNRSFLTANYMRNITDGEKAKLITGNRVIFTICYHNTNGDTTGGVFIQNIKLCNTSNNITISEVENSTIIENVGGLQIITKSFTGLIGHITVSNNFSFNIQFSRTCTVLNIAMYQGNALMGNFSKDGISEFKNYFKQNPANKKWQIRVGDGDNDFENIVLNDDLNSVVQAHNDKNTNVHGLISTDGDVVGTNKPQSLNNKSLNSPIIDEIKGDFLIKSTSGETTSKQKMDRTYNALTIDELMGGAGGDGVIAVNAHNARTTGGGESPLMHGITESEGNVVATDKTQTLTNKTIVTPIIKNDIVLDAGFTIPANKMGNGDTALVIDKINIPVDDNTGAGITGAGIIATNATVKTYVDEEVGKVGNTHFATFNIIRRSSDGQGGFFNIISQTSEGNMILKKGISLSPKPYTTEHIIYKYIGNDWLEIQYGSPYNDHYFLKIGENAEPFKANKMYIIDISATVSAKIEEQTYFSGFFSSPKLRIYVGYNVNNTHYMTGYSTDNGIPLEESTNNYCGTYPNRFSTTLFGDINNHERPGNLELSGNLKCLLNTNTDFTDKLGKIAIGPHESDLVTPNAIYIEFYNGGTDSWNIYSHVYIKGTIYEL